MTIIQVDVDLNDYIDECEETLNGGIKQRLQDLIDELEKELYIYTTKSNITVEDIYNKLKEII